MPIQSSLPSSTRKPGAYHEFDFSSAGQQLVSLDRRLVIVAEKSAAGTATADVPVQLFGEADGDEKCGVGSISALMNRKALLQAKLSGFGAPEIWVTPLTEPGAGTAAIFTSTVTGPATESKDLILKFAGRLIVVGVTNGDTATVVALAIKNKCDELAATLPFTAGVAAGVLTLTFRTKGVNGTDVTLTTLQLPTGLAIVHANPTPGAGVVDPTAALAALYDQRYLGIVLSNHVAGDAAVLLADAAFAWGYGQKNYRFYALGVRASLGTATTLQDSFNDYRFLIVSCEGSGSLPGEIAVAAMTAWLARELPNANLAGERLALDPPAAADAYTDPEIESALAGGVTPLVPDGAFVKIVRPVTTQITVNGAPNDPLREPALPRTAAYMAEQIDAGFASGFHQEVQWEDPNGGDDILSRARDMVIDKHRAAEKLRILKNVDDHLPEILVEFSASVPGRLVAQDPMEVAGPLYQGAFNHIMTLR